MPDLADAVVRLRVGWSLDFARVRRVLAVLGDGATLGGLVAASGLPRRDVEAVLFATRNQMDVIVKHVLTGCLSTVHDDVHVIALGHLADDIRELHRHLEQVHRQLGWRVDE